VTTVGTPRTADPDEVVRLPCVPLGGVVHRFGRLVPRVVFRRWNDDAHLLCRVVELPEVVDALVAVLVSDDERLAVQVRLASECAVAQHIGEFLVVDAAVVGYGAGRFPPSP